MKKKEGLEWIKYLILNTYSYVHGITKVYTTIKKMKKDLMWHNKLFVNE